MSDKFPLFTHKSRARVDCMKSVESEASVERSSIDASTNRVSLRQKISWSIGSVADQFMTNGLNNLALPIYNLSFGISPVLIGYALAIPRVFDAILDLLMGNISDNTRTRWGRRRPYVFIGGILCGLFFTLVWTPPRGLGSTGLFLYFLLMSILYYVAYTIFSVTRQALGYELSTDYNERTSVFAYNAVFAGLAGFAIPWLYKLSFHPFFAGPHKDAIIGVRWVGLLSGLLIIATALPGALFTTERSTHKNQSRIGLLKAIKLTLSNSPYKIITGVVVLILLAVMLAGPMNLYISIYYICNGNKEMGAFWGGWAGTAQALMGILSVPLITALSKRIGKKSTILCGLCLAIIGYFATWWLFNPKFPWLQLFFMLMLQPGLMTVWVLSGSIISDICDDDELRSGLRREGMFGAVFTFVTKAASALITIVASYILIWAGYKGEPVSAATITNMRVLFITIPVILLFTAIWLTIKFPLTEKVARDIRAQLDARQNSTNG